MTVDDRTDTWCKADDRGANAVDLSHNLDVISFEYRVGETMFKRYPHVSRLYPASSFCLVSSKLDGGLSSFVKTGPSFVKTGSTRIDVDPVSS